jgi:hypothetical protein
MGVGAAGEGNVWPPSTVVLERRAAMPPALGRYDGAVELDVSRRRGLPCTRHVDGDGFGVMMGMTNVGWRRAARSACAAALLALLAGPAAADEIFTYRVVHPTFGDIGRYIDRVSRNGDEMQIVSQLHVAVRVLGMMLHREDADRTEVWRGGRLMRFESVTFVNGDRYDVHGEARDGSFVVTTPTGVKVAPADVIPANPWSARSSAEGTLMSTKTGRLETVQGISVEDAVIPVLGVNVHTQHYVIATDKRQDVWKDARGVPVLFRTDETFGAIDFVLVSEANAPATVKAGSNDGGGTVVGSHP